MTTILRVQMVVQVPRTPNFLLLDDGQSVPLYAASDDALAEIGKQWTEALIKKAQRQRADAKEQP